MTARQSTQKRSPSHSGGGRTRRSFTPEFKLEAVRLAGLGDRPTSALAGDLHAAAGVEGVARAFLRRIVDRDA